MLTKAKHASDADGARLVVRREGSTLVVDLSGSWEKSYLTQVDAPLRDIAPENDLKAVVDISKVDALDTAGAWLIYRYLREWRRHGLIAELKGGKPAFRGLVDTVAENDAACPEPPRPVNAWVAIIARVGHSTLQIIAEAAQLISFLGATTAALGRGIVHPRRVRWVALIHHMERAGLDAMPIVGLISFLVGVVLAFQGADQLGRFGAEIFTVNLVGIGVLREMGVLLTAIVLAGRSGSAFAAQIGTMKVNQEVDAMQVMGFDPLDVLVVPRVAALILTLPLLTFYADLMGLAGGAVMAMLTLDISLFQYLRQLNDAVTPAALWVGLVKAPVFAFIIGLVGCFEGLRVSGSAESVGLLTTRAVVEGIFLVIVLDAAFSIFFAVVGI